jgi:hypothetical protein
MRNNRYTRNRYYLGTRYNSRQTWVVYKNGVHVGYVNSASENYALVDAAEKFGRWTIKHDDCTEAARYHVSMIEE